MIEVANRILADDRGDKGKTVADLDDTWSISNPAEFSDDNYYTRQVV